MFVQLSGLISALRVQIFSLRQRKTLEDALLMTKDDFGKTFDALRHHQLANSSVLLCLNHNHDGDIEKVI